jgi:predicted transcriptional regulator
MRVIGMASLKRVFTLRLQDEIFDKLEELAKKEHRTMTNMIEYILLDYLSEYEQENGRAEKENE